MTFAYIPARGGSNGIPRKNMQTLFGMPLIAWSVRTAKEAGLSVVVATDDKEIANAAIGVGGSVFLLPGELTTDDALANEALYYAFEHTGWDYLGERVVMLQCTSPLTEPVDIRRALYHFEGCDSLFSGYPLYPYVWTPDIEPLEPQRQNRQDKRPYWQENGAIYIFKPWVFKETRTRFGGKIGVSPMSACLEIDEPQDMEMAEWMLKKRHRFVPEVSTPEAQSLSVATEEARLKHPTSPRNSSAQASDALHSPI